MQHKILVKSNMWIIKNEISIQDLLECSEGEHTESWAAVATPIGSSYSWCNPPNLVGLDTSFGVRLQLSLILVIMYFIDYSIDKLDKKYFCLINEQL